MSATRVQVRSLSHRGRPLLRIALHCFALHRITLHCFAMLCIALLHCFGKRDRRESEREREGERVRTKTEVPIAFAPLLPHFLFMWHSHSPIHLLPDKDVSKISIPIDETELFVSRELRCETFCAYTRSVARKLADS